MIRPIGEAALRRLRLAVVGMSLLLLTQCAPVPRPVGPDAAIESPLMPLFESLRALETGAADGPVRILLVGDDHIAADRFSGRLRARFQERFGNAGRGMMPPGIPFDYYAPTGVGVGQKGGWWVEGGATPHDGPLGLTGFRLRGGTPGAELTLVSDEGFDSAVIEVLRAPGGGTATVEIDDVPVGSIATAAPTVGTARMELPTPAGSRRLTLRLVGDGPVTLLSWTVERDRRGVVLDSQGVIGATVDIIAAWDRSVIAAELAARRPALIMVAYGTNDARGGAVDTAAYRARFAERVRRLAAAAPGAGILVIGPPDSAQPVGTCTGSAPMPRSVSCTVPTADAADPAPSCHWQAPAGLAPVIAGQESAAIAAGYGFWDWRAMMGGACSIDRWARTVPALARSDRMRLRPDGYAASADALFDHLMAGYDAWRAAQSSQ